MCKQSLYFGVMVQCVGVCFRIAELFGMASFSSFFVCLLLLDFHPDYGGIIFISSLRSSELLWL